MVFLLSEDMEKKKKVAPCIIVHGGAWEIPHHFTVPYIEGVQQAVRAGYDVLKNVSTGL